MAKVKPADFLESISGRVSRRNREVGNCYYDKKVGNVLARVRFNTTNFNAVQTANQSAFMSAVTSAKAVMNNPTQLATQRASFAAQSKYKNFFGWLVASYIDTARTKQVTVVSSNTSYGTVSGGGQYAIGTSVTLTATPVSGHTFTSWSDGVTTASRTIVVTANLNLTATFA